MPFDDPPVEEKGKEEDERGVSACSVGRRAAPSRGRCGRPCAADFAAAA